MSMLASRLRAFDLPRYLKHDATRGAAVSVVMAGSAAMFSFGLYAALARVMPTAEFGVLASWLNVLLFCAVVASFGQETLVLRHWNEFIQASQPGRARGLLHFGVVIVIVGAGIVALGIGVAAIWRPESGLLIGLMILFLFAHTLSLYASQTARVTAGIAAGVVHREITWRVIVLAGLASTLYSGMPFTITFFFALAAGGLAVAVILQARRTVMAAPDAVFRTSPEMDTRPWIARSFRLWLASLMEASNQYLDVVVIAALLASSDVAIFFVCIKLAAIFMVLGDAFSLYSTRRISALFYSGDKEQLQSLLGRLSVITCVLVACGLLVVFFAGDILLGLFGASYRSQQTLLIALCLGTAATVLGGPATHLLLLTGHETAYLRALTAFSVLRYGAIAVAALLWGLPGVTVAVAATMSIAIVTLIWLCRRRLGLDPSILYFIARP